MEGRGRGLILRCYQGICLERLRKTIKNLSHDSQSWGPDLNPRSSEYEARLLSTRSRR
jgi:hypothetical protein